MQLRLKEKLIMSDRAKLAIMATIFAGVGGWAIYFLFSHDIAVLNPKGMIAEKQRTLLVIATALMLIVVIPVFLMTFLIAWKYRASNKKAKYHPDWDFSMLAETTWWTIPCLIIAALAIFNWKGCHELDPFKPIESHKEKMVIQAVALDWKWLFIYPKEKIATVNFVQFPEKTPIHFEITADAPMNSFWIPQLGGQIYAMAGMKSELHLIADVSDSFRGSSANISGEGFSGMKFTTKSSSQEDFDAWVGSVKKSSPILDMNGYAHLVEPTSYHPEASYRLGVENLFEEIISKYMGMEHATE